MIFATTKVLKFIVLGNRSGDMRNRIAQDFVPEIILKAIHRNGIALTLLFKPAVVPHVTSIVTPVILPA